MENNNKRGLNEKEFSSDTDSVDEFDVEKDLEEMHTKKKRTNYKVLAAQVPQLPAARGKHYLSSEDKKQYDIDELNKRIPDVKYLAGDDNDTMIKHNLIAYAYHVKGLGPPPQIAKEGVVIRTWEELKTYIEHLPYLSQEWLRVHSMFMSASSSGSVLGLGNKSVEHVWQEYISPPPPAPKNRYLEYMMARGLRFEPFIRELYMLLMGPRGVIIKESSTTMHPVQRWFIATPDGLVFQRNPNGTETFLRNVEWKAPYMRNAFVKIPADYMAQIQLTMWVTGASECDFGSLKVIDTTLESEFVLIRVYRNDEYIAEAVRVMSLFICAVLTNSQPPDKREFQPPTSVRTDMIYRMTDVISLVPNGASKIKTALRLANADADRAILS